VYLFHGEFERKHRSLAAAVLFNNPERILVGGIPRYACGIFESAWFIFPREFANCDELVNYLYDVTIHPCSTKRGLYFSPGNFVGSGELCNDQKTNHFVSTEQI